MDNKKNSGYRKKSAARLAAVQVLYTQSMMKISEHEALQTFQAHYVGKNLDEDLAIQPDEPFLNILVSGVNTKSQTLLELISPHLNETWKMERIDPILLNIIKCGTFELLSFPDTDTPIIISEYLDVTHAFFDKKDVGFVNGILNKIASVIRPL